MKNIRDIQMKYGEGRGLHALHGFLHFRSDAIAGFDVRRKAGSFARAAGPRCSYGNLLPDGVNDLFWAHHEALRRMLHNPIPQ